MKPFLRYYGDPILRKVSRAVDGISEEVEEIHRHLVEMVLAHDGAGLSAPQIGYDLRMFVICYSNQVDQMGMPIYCKPMLFINPKIVSVSKEEVIEKEGCLSIPGIIEKVSRPKRGVIEAIGIDGKPFTETLENWSLRVFLHENDHLNGTLFIDRISTSRKDKIKEFLKKLKKETHLR